MPEVLSRIAINADATWDFHRHVQTQALDLYSARDRTQFWTTTPRFADNADLAPLLGAFPEDFSQADSGLADELADAVRNLITAVPTGGGGETDRLSVLVVLSAADFAILSRVQGGPSRSATAELSEPGRIALDALAAALDTLRRAETRDGETEPARTRFWAGVAVRDLGHRQGGKGAPENDYADARKVLESLRQRLGGMPDGIVFLSNGAPGNNLPDAAAIQFFKLRAALDLLGRKEALSSLRAAVARGTSRAFWLQRTDPQVVPPSVSDSLARALLRNFDNGAGDGGVIDTDDDSVAESALDNLHSEAGGLVWTNAESARARIRQTVMARPDLLADTPATLGVKLDHRDMTDAIDKLSGVLRRGWFHSDRRIQSIRQLSPQFNVGFRGAQTMQDSVVDTLLQTDESLIPSRGKLLAELDRYHAPRGKAGLEKRVTLMAFLQERIGQAAQVIAQARQVHGAQPADSGEASRVAAFEAVLATEENLLRRKALWLPLGILAALVYVALVWELVRSVHVAGHDLMMVASALATTYWKPIGGMLVLALVITALVAWRISRKRLRASDMLTERLRNDWKGLAEASARRLEAASARRVAAQWRLILNRIAVAEDLGVTDRMDQFMDLIRSAVGSPVDADLDGAIARQIDQFARSGASRADRLIASLLKVVPPPDSGTLVVSAETLRAEPFELRSAAVVGTVVLRLDQGREPRA